MDFIDTVAGRRFCDEVAHSFKRIAQAQETMLYPYHDLCRVCVHKNDPTMCNECMPIEGSPDYMTSFRKSRFENVEPEDF